MSGVITLQQLKKKGACPEQVRRFKALFGEKVNVTVDIAKRYGQKFSCSWAAEILLTRRAANKFYRSWDNKNYWDLSIEQQNTLDAVTFARLYSVKANRRAP